MYWSGTCGYVCEICFDDVCESCGTKGIFDQHGDFICAACVAPRELDSDGEVGCKSNT
jgi:hypothetical protein